MDDNTQLSLTSQTVVVHQLQKRSFLVLFLDVWKEVKAPLHFAGANIYEHDGKIEL